MVALLAIFLLDVVVSYFQARQLLRDTGPLTVLDTTQQALLALETFNSTWQIGLAAFGLHLILLGCLVLQSVSAPKHSATS